MAPRATPKRTLRGLVTQPLFFVNPNFTIRNDREAVPALVHGHIRDGNWFLAEFHGHGVAPKSFSGRVVHFYCCRPRHKWGLEGPRRGLKYLIGARVRKKG